MAGGISDRGEVLTSVEVYEIRSKALRKGGALRQPRAFFKIIPVGSKHPRLLAIGGEGGTSWYHLNTTEWWEEEDNNWEEGPALSTGRSNFGALMAPGHLVCSEINPPAHSCPTDVSYQICVFPTSEPGTSTITPTFHIFILVMSIPSLS